MPPVLFYKTQFKKPNTICLKKKLKTIKNSAKERYYLGLKTFNAFWGNPQELNYSFFFNSTVE